MRIEIYEDTDPNGEIGCIVDGSIESLQEIFKALYGLTMWGAETFRCNNVPKEIFDKKLDDVLENTRKEIDKAYSRVPANN